MSLIYSSVVPSIKEKGDISRLLGYENMHIVERNCDKIKFLFYQTNLMKQFTPNKVYILASGNFIT